MPPRASSCSHQRRDELGRVDQPVACGVPDEVAVAAIRLRRVVAAVEDRLLDDEREVLHHRLHVIVTEAADGPRGAGQQRLQRLSPVGAGTRLGLDEGRFSGLTEDRGAICRQASQSMQVESTKKSPGTFSGTRFRGFAMTEPPFLHSTVTDSALTTLGPSSRSIPSRVGKLTARRAGNMTNFICTTCGTQYAESERAARRLRHLPGRAPVRQGHGPAVDDPRQAAADQPQLDPVRGAGADRHRHRPALRHRPAGLVRADAAGQRPVGLPAAAG